MFNVENAIFLTSCLFCLLSFISTNTNDYPAAWINITNPEDGSKSLLYDSKEDCCVYFTKTGLPASECEMVDVCSPDCCSYSKKHGLPLNQCQDDCSAFTTTPATTTTTSTTTTSTTTTTTPEKCEDYSFSEYWHPVTGGDILW
jgi:hypothetical protein